METISIPDVSAFALVFSILVVAGSGSWRTRNGAIYIILSWMCLLLGRLPLESTLPFSIELGIYTTTRLLFPVFIFIGSLEFLGKKPPRILYYVTATLLPAVFLMMSIGLDVPAILIGGLLNCLLFTSSAWVLYAQGEKHQSKRLLTLLASAYVLLALLSLDGIVSRLIQTPFHYYIAIWSVVAGITAALQMLLFMKGSKRERDHLRRTSDVTAAQLSDLHARLQLILENTHDIIVETDASGNILYITPNVYDMLGYSQEGALGANIINVFHWDDIEWVSELSLTNLQGEGRVIEPFRIQHRNGSWHWLACSVQQYQTPQGENRWVTNVRDVTEKIEHQAQLKNFQTRFEAMALNSNDVILELSTDGSLNYITPNAAQVTGYPLTTLSKLTVREILNLLKAEPFTSKTGKPASWKKEFKEFENSSHPIDKQQQITTMNGNTKWIEIEASTYNNDNGEPCLIAIIRDITDRVNISEQLQKSKLMESLGMIASGVAHDFNNLLAIIQGNAELTRDDINNGSYEHAQDMLTIISSASTQAADLTSQLLTYAGKGSFHMADVNINSIINDLKSLLSVAVPHTNIEYDLADRVPIVRADASHIRQIIMNLVINSGEACEAVPDGVITLSTSVINHKSNGENQSELSLKVNDNGKGMDAGVAGQIFEPFFTTKFEGRGLGLAAVFGIVNAHGGRVEVESNEGEGSTLQIIFPGIAQTQAKAPQLLTTTAPNTQRPDHSGSTVQSPQERSPMILVVDDEPRIGELIETMLKNKGHIVKTANGVNEALTVYTQYSSRISLCIIDYSLPTATGMDLYQQLTKIDDELQVIYMSGYDQATIKNINRSQNDEITTNNLNALHKPESGGVSVNEAFIQKPFTTVELLEKISSVNKEKP